MLTKRVLLISISYLACSMAANASDASLSASSGKTLKVRAYSSWDKACNGAPSVVDVVKAPQHGSINVRAGTTTVTRAIGSSKCLGQNMPASVVFYTPAPGFHGTDDFTLEQHLHNNGVNDDHFVVSVR